MATNNIENDIVSLQFDNANFEKNVQVSMNTLSNLKKNLDLSESQKNLQGLSDTANNFSLGNIAESANIVADRFSTMGIIGMTALQNITNQAIQTGERMIKALTLDPIMSGFQEYETQINATQTILANTKSKGKDINDVNWALKELNDYADLTIYNFTEMTRNIGTFTAAGVGLEDSVAGIQGIANLAAVSGSTSEQASRAMYQLSQALASGTVKLMDWNSVVNAGMGGEQFQEAIKETAREYGIAIDDMIENEGSFRETLSKGWFTDEILMASLKKFTTSGVNEYLAEHSELTLKDIQNLNDQNKSVEENAETLSQYVDLSKEEIQTLLDRAKTAQDAATKVKTFTQLWDVLKEATQSGWTQTWQIIIGDFEEAKELLTSISDFATEAINKISTTRNDMLKSWKDLGGRADLIEGLKNIFEGLVSVIKPVSEALSKVFPAMKGEQLYEITKGFKEFTASLKLSEQSAKNLKNIFQGLFSAIKIGLDVVKTLVGFIWDIGSYAVSSANKLLGLSGIFGNIAGTAGSLANTIRTNLTPAFEIFKIVLGLISETVKGVIGVTVELLDPFNKLIGDFLSKIFATSDKDSIFVEVLNALKEMLPLPSDIAKLFDMLKESIHKAFSNGIPVIGTLFDKLVELKDFLAGFINNVLPGTDKLKSGVNDVNTSISRVFTKFQQKVDIPFFKDNEIGVKKSVADLGDLKSSATDTFDTITIKSETAGKSILNKLSSNFKLATDNMVKLANSISDKLSPVINKIKDEFSKMEIGRVIQLGSLVSLVVLFNKIKNSLSNIRDELSGFRSAIGSIGRGISDLGRVFDPLTKYLKVMQTEVKADILKSIALSVVMLAGAVFLISKVDSDKLVSGMVAISAMLLEVMAVLVAIIKMGDMDNKSLLKSSATIWIISEALLVMSKALNNLSNFTDWNQTKQILLITAAMTVELIAVFNTIVNAASKLNDSQVKTLRNSGIVLLEIAAALDLMALGVKILGSMNIDALNNGFLALTGLLIGVISFAKILDKINLKSIGVNLLALSVSLNLLIAPIVALGLIPFKFIQQGLYSIALVVGGLTAAMLLLNNVNTNKVAVSILSLAVSLNLLIAPIIALGLVPWNVVDRGLESLGKALIELVVAVYAVSGVNIEKVSGTLIAMSVAMNLLIIPIAALGSLPFKTIAKGLYSMVASLLMLSGTVAVMSRFKKQLEGMSSALLKIGASIALFGVGLTLVITAIKLLSTLGTVAEAAILTAATAIAVGLVTILGLVIKFLKTQIKPIGEDLFGIVIETLDVLLTYTKPITSKLCEVILEFLDGLEPYLPTIVKKAVTILLKGINEIFKSVGKYNTSSVAGFAAAMVTLTIAIKTLANAKTTIKDALISGGLLAVLCASIAATLYVIGSIPFESLIKSVLALDFMIMTLTNTFVILSNTRMTIKEAIVSIGTIGALLAEIVASVAILSSFDSTSVLTAMSGISALIVSLSISSSLLKGLNPGAAVGVIGTLGILLAGLMGIMVALGEMADFMDYLGGDGFVDSMLDTTNGILVKIGNGIGGFIGGIFSGAVSNAVSALPTVGQSLTDFMNNAQGFLTGISSLNESSVTGAKYLAETVLIFTAAELLDGLSNLVGTTDFAKFTTMISDLGPAISKFAEDVSSIDDPSKVEHCALAAKAIAEFANAIPREGGLWQELAGNVKDLKTFATDLSSPGDNGKTIGQSIKQFGDDVSGVDIQAVKDGAEAGQYISDLANNLTKSGGLWQYIVGETESLTEFANQLPNFGEKLKEYSEKVQGLDVSSIEKSTKGAKLLVELSTSLKKEDGFWQEIVGETQSITDFANELPNLGEKLKIYSNSIANIDDKKVASSASAAKMLVDLSNALPNEGGLISLFTGNKTTVKEFGEQLPSFGKALSDYSASISGINSNQLFNVTSGINELVKIAGNMENVDSSKFGNFSEALGKLAKAGIDAFVSKFNNSTNEVNKAVKEWVSDFCSAVEGKKDDVSKSFVKIINEMTSKSSSKKDEFYKTGKTFMDSFRKAIDDKCDETINAMRGVVTHLHNDVLNSKWGDFYWSGQYLMDAFRTAIDNKYSEAFNAMYGFVKNIHDNAINSQWDDFYWSGGYLIDGFVSGMSNDDKYRSVKSAARNLAKKAMDSMNDELDIHSPSKETEKTGKFFGQGFINGIKEFISKASDTSEDLASSATKGINIMLDKVSRVINDDLDMTPTITPVIDLSEVQNGANQINSMLNLVSTIGFASTNARLNNLNSNDIQKINDEGIISEIGKLRNDLNNNPRTVNNNFNITGDDPREIANEVSRRIQQQVERRGAVWE